MLVLVTLFFGQINEARQFLALTPIALALTGCLIKSKFGATRHDLETISNPPSSE
jgi:hypothetical protein